MGSELLLVIVVVTALAFDFTNGFHDTANAMATSIATGRCARGWRSASRRREARRGYRAPGCAGRQRHRPGRAGRRLCAAALIVGFIALTKK